MQEKVALEILVLRREVCMRQCSLGVRSAMRRRLAQPGVGCNTPVQQHGGNHVAEQEGRFEFAGSDGARVAGYRWGAKGPAKRILQVAHGMGEHAMRYQAPLAPLVRAGYVIYANDHRGHGHTATSGTVGDYGPGGYNQVVDDMVRLTRHAKSENPGAQVVLLGHSMGSMLAQGYILDHAEELAGLALSGTTSVDKVTALAAHPRGLEAVNEPFEPGRTPFDWLSRDEKEVDSYIADPLCGFSLKADSMVSLFSQGERLANPSELARIPKNYPIYIFVGDEDPVNAKLAWLNPLIERYKAVGASVDVDIYRGARHEVLNETNRDEVVANLKSWLNQTFSNAEAKAA
jgi:alpha-beta hydrolase superfamily lysophospholipase